jgi:hypothetical protein
MEKAVACGLPVQLLYCLVSQVSFSDTVGTGHDVQFVHLGQHEDPAGRLGQHPVVGDPRFMDPEAGDFRLSPGSPALGLGAHSG